MLGTPRFEGMASEGSLEQIGSGITVSFMIPAGMGADTLSILFWDRSENYRLHTRPASRWPCVFLPLKILENINFLADPQGG